VCFFAHGLARDWTVKGLSHFNGDFLSICGDRAEETHDFMEKVNFGLGSPKRENAWSFNTMPQVGFSLLLSFFHSRYTIDL
jgi:hypothetical protein